MSTWIQTENEAITHSPIEPYKLFLLKKPLLSIHEAACIISEDDPNIVTRCEHDTNFDQNFNNYLHAFNFVDAAIKANDLACDDSQFYGIKNTDLKNYLISTGIIVDGFTDTIPAQNQSNFGTPAIQQIPPNIENLNAEIARLRDKLDLAEKEKQDLLGTIKKLDEKLNFSKTPLAPGEAQLDSGIYLPYKTPELEVMCDVMAKYWENYSDELARPTQKEIAVDIHHRLGGKKAEDITSRKAQALATAIQPIKYRG